MSRSLGPMFDAYRGDPEVIYHGTTPDKAEMIHHMGFDDDLMGTANGQTAGSGHYFAGSPEQAAKYGPSVVAARLGPHVDVHPNPWRDVDVQEGIEALQATHPAPAGVDKEDWRTGALLNPVLHNLHYRAHADPDDGAIVVHSGRDVTPLGVAHSRQFTHWS